MGRAMSGALRAHIRSEATTVCCLLRVSPQIPGFEDYGVTDLDRDLVYDDGSGELVYSAPIGFQPTAIAQTSDLSVDNAESMSLMPEYDIPASEEDLRAGAYDFARYWLYLVNYQDLSQGHVTLQSGTIGKVSVRDDGLSFVNELRGLAAKLKQSICEKDSLTCRATFGSQPFESLTPGPQVRRGWCGYDAESLLVEAAVLDVGLESTRSFQISESSPGFEEGGLVPGIVKFLSGRNAGRTFEIESNTVDGWISLAHETAYPIAVDDDLEYRPDCNKHARDEEKGCKFWFEEEWVLHFRGEPDIPIGDAGAMEMPGASAGVGTGGFRTIDIETDET